MVRWVGVAAVGTAVAVATAAGAWSASSGVFASTGVFPQAQIGGRIPSTVPISADAAAAPTVEPQLTFAPASPHVPASPLSRATNARIGALIPGLINPQAFGSDYAIDVMDADTGDAIMGHRAKAPMRPASTMKLITAFTSLSVLGPKTRTPTSAVMTGPHDVAVVGGGDSLLTSQAVVKLAKKAGKRLAGRGQIRVHVVDQRFGKWVRGPGWPKEYVPSVATPVSSLAYLGDYTTTPQQHVGKEFTKALKGSGVPARYAGRSTVSAGRVVAVQRGSTVAAQVDWMLQHSENNIAEILFRQVALKMGHKPNWVGSATAARSVLEQGGIPTKGLVLKDGSGLSRADRAPAALLNAVLARAVDHPANPALTTVFYGQGLPTAGRTGTLVGRFSSQGTSCAQGRVRAKTGSLHDVISLSGVTRGADHHLKIFTVIINNLPQTPAGSRAREAVDKVVTAVVGCAG
ncbi:MAG: D-alanyl-D-alanine carboxypeptidase/D-alanyl-D-alanine-endopeptidase [Candidatus Nanopelagicales bacterium]